jgi:hypothetical protein
MLKPIICFISFFILSGCIITHTPGFYHGYDQLTEEEKNTVVFTQADSSICMLNQNGKVYAVTGRQLSECLKKNNKSIIYRWGPNCSSKECILISACQDFCNSGNYNLYVVADYYDLDKMEVQNVSDFPILVANHKYYGKNYANKLNKYFIKDLLMGATIDKGDKYKRFMFFEGDKLIKCKSNLFP